MRGETEEWRGIAGLEKRYQVSDTGRIRSARSRMIVPLVKGEDGHIWATLEHTGGAAQGVKVSVAVAKAFHGAPKGLEPLHLDGNLKNNRADNIRWKVTYAWRTQ